MVLAVIWPNMASMDLPDFLATWLDSWGSKMRCQMHQAATHAGLTWPRFCSGSPGSSGFPGSGSSSTPILKLGTDCSGLDAPVYALRALEIPHTHVFSCETNKAARAMINMNCKPGVFFADVLTSCQDVAPFCHL